MKLKVISIFFFLLLSGIPQSFAIKGSLCGVRLRTKKILKDALSGIQQVKDTLGLRIALAPKGEELPRVAYGFARRQGPLQKWVIPFYPFVYPIRSLSYLTHLIFRKDTTHFSYPSLIRGLFENLYLRPSTLGVNKLRHLILKNWGDKLSPELQKFLSQELKPSATVNSVVAFVIFHLLYGEVNQFNQELLVSKQQEWIDDDSEFWLNLLENDPYYLRIKRLYESNHLTKTEAIQEVFVRALSLDMLYTAINQQHLQNENIEDKMFHDKDFKEALGPVLPATFYLQEHGPLKRADFQIPEEMYQPASNDQMRELLEINIQLLRRRSMIRAYFEDRNIFNILREKTSHIQEWKSLITDPQVRFYFRELGKKHITEARAKYLLLEWTQIKERFERWSLFHATWHPVSNKGKVVRLEDLLEWRKFHLEDDLPYFYENAEIYPLIDLENRSRLKKPLNHYVRELAFLRMLEPGLQQSWYSLNQYVQFFKESSTRTGLTGDMVAVSADSSQTGKEISYVVQSTGNIGRLMAISSSAIVYADFTFRWIDLHNLKKLVHKTARELLYLEDTPEKPDN